MTFLQGAADFKNSFFIIEEFLGAKKLRTLQGAKINSPG